MKNYLVKWVDRGEDEFWLTISEMQDQNSTRYDHSQDKINAVAKSRNEVVKKIVKLDEAIPGDKKITYDGKEYKTFLQLSQVIQNE